MATTRTKFHCNECKRTTWHEVVAEHSQEIEDALMGLPYLTQGQILKCCGCEQLSFRLFEHPFDFDEKGKIVEQVFPVREYKKRTRKVSGLDIPAHIFKLYTQTVEAYDASLYLLAAMGLRSLVEAMVIDRLNPSEYMESIKSKIDALSRHFSEDVIKTIHEFRFMGNKAVHSLEEPDRLDIHRALSVIEDILTGFYGVERSARVFSDFRDRKKLKAAD